MKKLLQASIAFVGFFLFAAGTLAEPKDIGIVIMHGKGGSPNRWVSDLAYSLERQGYQVANIEMPWSGERQYDVTVKDAEDEVTAALTDLRRDGVKKVFVSGHSQGGTFAFYYATNHDIDGVIGIAPGGQVDSPPFRKELGNYVKQAKRMIDEGKGSETAKFADYEGSRGNNFVTTTADIYFDWFNPDGTQTSNSIRKINPNIPVLYISPKQDYPGLKKNMRTNYNSLPRNALTKLYEPDSNHMGAPGASSTEIIHWINQVSGS